MTYFSIFESTLSRGIEIVILNVVTRSDLLVYIYDASFFICPKPTQIMYYVVYNFFDC